MDGQAPEAPLSVDDVAAFLVANPQADQAPGTEQDGDKSAQADNLDADFKAEDADKPDEPDDDGKEPASEKAESQTSGRKFKVPVKGEDGADSMLEVDEKELIAGYQRHADYTRKTQDLGNREREATELVERKHTEYRTHYMQQSELALRTVQMLAGLKSDAELADLAQTNPSAWVAERQRSDLIKGAMSQIAQGMQHEQQQAEAKKQENADKVFHTTWGVLGKEGIDKPKLQTIFDGVHKAYGVERERFANVTDPKLVLIMRDAMRYRDLQEKTAAARQKVQAAPKLPPPRQAVPRREQVNATLERRFKSGKAGTRDLASWIAANHA